MIDLDFELPRLPPGRAWHRSIDTSAPPPEDIAEDGRGSRVPAGPYRLPAGSLAVLVAGPDPGSTATDSIS